MYDRTMACIVIEKETRFRLWEWATLWEPSCFRHEINFFCACTEDIRHFQSHICIAATSVFNDTQTLYQWHGKRHFYQHTYNMCTRIHTVGAGMEGQRASWIRHECRRGNFACCMGLCCQNVVMGVSSCRPSFSAIAQCCVDAIIMHNVWSLLIFSNHTQVNTNQTLFGQFIGAMAHRLWGTHQPWHLFASVVKVYVYMWIASML